MIRKKNKYSIAVIGASSAVGRELFELMEERNFPVDEVAAFASDDTAGERIEFRGKSVMVRKPEGNPFESVDIAFISEGRKSALEFAPAAVKAGAVAIDSSNAYRMDRDVPLVVPEVNANAVERHKGIIASPSCPTVALVITVKPIHEAAKVRRLVVTTFQSVAGTGKEAMEELAQQTVALLNFRDIETSAYPHQIAFNAFPHVDSFLDNGYTSEEMNIMQETGKILGDESLRITATAVRVPVFRGLAATVNIETEKKLPVHEIRAVLAAAPGIVVYDDPGKNVYPTIIDVVGKDDTYAGRIRDDASIPNGLNMWIASDNLRKGAALNALQIAEELIKPR